MNSDRMTFPVDSVMPDLLRAFDSSNIVILSAPPGAGKTTRVPIALLKHSVLNNGKMLILEPRRLAARRAAEFMSDQLRENVGTTIGYRIRGENRCGPNTRIEVVTEGILTRMLQREPDLPDVKMIVFDEFHERSIHADLGLAFSLDVQKHLRSDLRILIMSATLNAEHITSVLGSVPVVESKGKLYPIDTRYSKFSSEKPIEIRIADVVQRALANDEGDVLVFLPGWREIQRTERALSERTLPEGVVLHTLHGESPVAAQNSALSPASPGKRKVILSTNVAETSLTIEGVRVVVDSGLVRVARFDPRRGMSGLITLPISKASADQRRGRSGRLAPGVCYRLWTEAEHERLADFSQPEIKSADLAPLALDLAQWGTPNGENLIFLDPPPSGNLQQAQAILRDLEATDQKGLLTPIGRSMTELPVHPRLGHMIMRSKSLRIGGLGCEIAALLEERDLFAGQKDADVDLTSRWMDLRNAKGNIRDKIASQARRLKEVADITIDESNASSVGLLLAFAYPDRVAKRRDKNGNAYLMASGTTGILPPGSAMARNEFLSIADADTVGTSIRIFLCAPVTLDELRESFEEKIVFDEVIEWNSANKRVDARSLERLGAIVFSERPITNDDERIVSAMVEGIRSMGLQVLPWSKESQSLRERSEWLRTNGLVPGEWPDLSEPTLTASLEVWLGPFLSGVRQQSHLSRLNLLSILTSLFSHRQLHDLEDLAPQRVKLPSGTSALIDYTSAHQPVLAVRLQEMFGQTDTPRLGHGKIPLVIHLLSPAKRPLAVTQDLRSFWQNTYPDIRNQLRAKYPKHLWPDDPIHTAPTSRTKKNSTNARKKSETK
jgi:ATP-dependent helicase HrpB